MVEFQLQFSKYRLFVAHNSKIIPFIKKMLYLNRAVYCRINGGHSINGVSKVINLKKYYQRKVPFKSDIFIKLDLYKYTSLETIMSFE